MLKRLNIKNKIEIVLKMSSQTKSAVWSNGLIGSMDDPELLVISSDSVVIIKDKYPKAQHHFLILPRENIHSIYKLNKSHIPLLDEIELMATNAFETTGRPIQDFKLGYHSSPSMSRLHLHVISTDFHSTCLKTKAHWNSFTTEFFLPMTEVHTELRTAGLVRKNPDLEICLKTDLQCHRCAFKPKTMPDLKRHIFTHIS